jgi:hypothetical protein
MNPSNVFQVELASQLARPRALAMKLAMPVLLAMPLALVAMPPRAKAGGLVMLLLFLSFFGSAVAGVRRRTEGQAERLRALPGPVWRTWTGWLLADATVDLMQAACVLVLFLSIDAAEVGAADLLVLAALTSAVLVAMNLLGTLLAAAMKGNAEVHLVGALAVGAVAAVSGLFPTPRRLAAVVESTGHVNPVHLLAAALADATAGRLSSSPTAIAVAAVWLALLGFALAVQASAGVTFRKVADSDSA